MNEILDETLALLQAGRDFALVKLIGDRGSTPRAAGAEMLVRRDGSIAGTIGGGALEGAMMRAAGEVLESRRSRVLDMSLAGRDVHSDAMMLCGGEAEVLIAYVPSGDPELLAVCAAVRAAQAGRRRVWYFTLMPQGDETLVEHCLLGQDGAVIGAQPCEPKALRTAVGKIAVHGSTTLAEGRRVLVEHFAPRSTAVICGGGHVGMAVAPAALAAGFAVTVIDDREEFADPRRFPGAHVVLTSFDGALRKLGIGAESYVVIVTRGHAYDMDMLVQALRTPAVYVGMMASRGKWARIVAALRDEGFSDDDIARVHSPIGLQIGAEAPAELAVSIVAELIQARAASRT